MIKDFYELSAVLWRKVIGLLLQGYRRKPLDIDREKILRTLREDFIKYDISKAYDKYKNEEKYGYGIRRF